MIPPVRPRIISHGAATAAFLVGVFLISFVALPGHGQDKEIDQLASEVTAAIIGEHRNLFVTPSVRVGNFVELHGSLSELDEYLAGKFSAALMRRQHGFMVVGRQDLETILREEKVAPEELNNRNTLSCFNPNSDVTIVVEGYFDVLDDAITLWIRVMRVGDRRVLYDRRMTLAKTGKIRELSTKPLHVSSSPLLPTNFQGDIVEAGTNGINLPRCIHCPRPEFTPEALKASVQGTVLLAVIIDAHGIPIKATVLKGLPCGLSERAVEAVKEWKFESALGRDGKPVSVLTTIEVMFRLL